MNSQFNVIIADDHPIFRKGLREIIESSSQFSVIAEAESGVTALKYYQEYQPDIIVLDISMGELNGLEVAEAILKEPKKALCVIMTMYNEEAFCKRALSLGVKGYLLKDDAPNSILECLKQVSSGQQYISHTFGCCKDMLKNARHEQTPEQVLSDKELQILKSIANLKTNKEMAKQYNISVRTVQNHRQNISSKLNLSGRQALLQFAVKWAEQNAI